eukprot:CAMPEP_0174716850 /NCGR_PEP_ID=MMETSP1094-20130205/24945_1 /TAXON_ID=156173 /ORGANISM="Chrysochromulina brevifilum, Strain UTEX LB 985" /LENGTH=54 /DNA_ID=CAMNT_0015916693 /DNA_START=64 /DNA_END=228 /DNA_ORIENTATION=+
MGGFELFDANHRRLQPASQQGGDVGDTIAILLFVTLILIAICAFLGWYSRRRAN